MTAKRNKLAPLSARKNLGRQVIKVNKKRRAFGTSGVMRVKLDNRFLH